MTQSPRPFPSLPTRYATELDGLRGLMALLVCLYHINWASYIGGAVIVYVGPQPVDFFFVLSGIVMNQTYPVLAGRAAIWAYAVRRFARLYPLHLLTLLAAASGFLLLSLVAPDRWDSIQHMPQVQNLEAKFIHHLLLLNAHGLAGAPGFNVPSWSIGAEMTAYILVPLVGLLAASRRGRVLLYLVIAAAALAYMSLIHKEFFWKMTEDLGVLRALACFSLGSAIYYMSDWLRVPKRLQVPLILACALAFPLLSDQIKQAEEFAIFISYPLMLVIMVALYQGDNAIARFLSLPFFQWLGAISYSVYMVHFLVRWGMVLGFNMLGLKPEGGSAIGVEPWVGDLIALFYVGLILLAAHISYRLFERPVQDWILDRTVRRKAKAAVAG